MSEIKSRPQQTTQIKQKPLLLLPQAKEIIVQPLATTVEPPLYELSSDININTLQLRRARKIAKALGIAQKVNKKDQPISWLRTQIKAKL